MVDTVLGFLYNWIGIIKSLHMSTHDCLNVTDILDMPYTSLLAVLTSCVSPLAAITWWDTCCRRGLYS